MGIFSKFLAKVKGNSTADPLDWQELERELIGADLGPSLSASLLEEAKKIKGSDAERSLKEILSGHLSQKDRTLSSQTPSAILIVGVNGTGKTTSCAKLASTLLREGKKITLGAADTFRAAAVEQLQTWGSRIGCDVVSGKSGADPAAVAFDSAQRAIEESSHYLILDTAGRLHTKKDLMSELEKVKRVIEKSLPVSEVLLVIDATTGQNGIAQAKIFAEAVEVTGLILTKMDGSARGGVALAIESSLDIPIKFIGTGEGVADFSPFVTDMYIDGLLR